MGVIGEILRSRELLANLVMREVRGQYKRTVFGQLWSLVNPLVQMLIYTLVFNFILRVTPQPGDPSGLHIFPLWLLCGLLPWAFFSSALQGGMKSLTSSVGLVQKVYFPRIVLPLSRVGATAYNWLFEMAVLLIVLTIAGAWVLPYLPLMIVTMVLLAMFGLGLGLMLSIVNVHFRDTEYLIGLVLQIWMYLTPIIYPASLMKSQSDQLGGLFGTDITLYWLYRLNPMERFVEIFRNLLYDNRLPSLGDFGFVTLAALIALALGLLIFKRNEKGLAEAL